MKALKLLPLVVALGLVACGEKTPPAASAPETSTAAPAAAPAASEPAAPAASAPAAAEPAASAAAPAAAPAAASASAAPAGDLATGEKVYSATCQACHGTGVLGAPKFGDKAAWAPRVAQGKDTLYAHAIAGIRMMPPKGGNASLKDEELKAAVDYMVSKAS